MELRHKTNDELFTLYDSELLLRVHNARNLDNERRLLAKFYEYLNSYPPSPELAKGFLSQYAGRKLRTLARYGATIKSFMKWYGQPLEDFRVRIPRTLPPYTEDSDIDKVRRAFESKATHKGIITRDVLLIDLALTTGMRRAELADLEPKDREGCRAKWETGYIAHSVAQGPGKYLTSQLSVVQVVVRLRLQKGTLPKCPGHRA